jgi:hypothetical protein
MRIDNIVVKYNKHLEILEYWNISCKVMRLFNHLSTLFTKPYGAIGIDKEVYDYLNSHYDIMSRYTKDAGWSISLYEKKSWDGPDEAYYQLCYGPIKEKENLC